MRHRLYRKILKEAEWTLGRLTAFGTENGKVCRLRYPRGLGWAFDWMFGEYLDIYDCPEDRVKVLHEIARRSWRYGLRDIWTRKLRGGKSETVC